MQPVEKKSNYKVDFEKRLRAMLGNCECLSKSDIDGIVTSILRELVTSFRNGIEAGQKRAGK